MTDQPIAIVIHGGAGTILRERMSPEVESAYRAGLEASVSAGYAVLAAGGAAIDAVVAAINVMEDSELFNAGKGAVFTHDGTIELDASIMEGRSHMAGAIAGVRHIKNPISLARAVMQRSPHVMLISEGAETFAQGEGFELVDNDYFKTDRRFKQLQDVLEGEAGAMNLSEDDDNFDMALKDKQHGTVGAVAFDCHGDIVAGTSTGGMTNKRFGRIGDSPIIGAGTWADNSTCGISATGHGEFFIRAAVAHDISARMAYKGISLQQAEDEVILEKLAGMHADGGVIGIDAEANIAVSLNSAGMYRAWIDKQGDMEIAIFR